MYRDKEGDLGESLMNPRLSGKERKEGYRNTIGVGSCSRKKGKIKRKEGIDPPVRVTRTKRL